MKERGFTLIELLVVIAILGIIAAVVALNVGSFFGMGREQAANTEVHQVKTAIVAYLADDTVTSFNGTIGPESNYPVSAPMNEGVRKYIDGQLQANYAVINGEVVNATLTEDSKWGDLYFCDGSWQLEQCD